MLKIYKLKIIISSVIVLLPILFGAIMWNDLPNTMISHFGADGIADGFSGKAFAIFGLPLILLVLHFICLLFTMLDKRQKEQNPKALSVIFWIFPMISLLTGGIMYRAAFGKEIDLTFYVPLLLGVMFIFIGNYIPKVKQNRTLGIKVTWTLNNDENWNKTHRFAGKVWVICGFLILLSIILPLNAWIVITSGIIIFAAFSPMIYSYVIYRKDLKAGISYEVPPKSKNEKLILSVSSILVAVIIVGITTVMFTGNIQVDAEENALKITATYWTDTEISYSEIDSVEYSNDLNIGVRTGGFGSPTLSLGIFQNEQFGSYFLYSYTGAKEFVILTSDGEILVIGMKDANETKALYNDILIKTAEK